MSFLAFGQDIRINKYMQEDIMGKIENKNWKIMTEEAVDIYCCWLADCEKSKGTIQKYRHFLLQFMDYMNGRGVDKECVLIWKELLKSHFAPITVNGALTALNGFFKFCNWDNCAVRFLKISSNPFCLESRELSKEEYQKLVRTAFDKGNERLALLLQTVCSSGIRISELEYVTVEAATKGKAEVDCKGRVRTVLLTRKLCTVLLNYAKQKGIINGKIFITRSGKSLDRSNIWREMKALGAEAGVEKDKIFPHNLRHLFARTYYEAEKDLSKLADILGHRDVNTTRIYTRESGSRHRIQLENLGLLLMPYNRLYIML